MKVPGPHLPPQLFGLDCSREQVVAPRWAAVPPHLPPTTSSGVHRLWCFSSCYRRRKPSPKGACRVSTGPTATPAGTFVPTGAWISSRPGVTNQVHLLGRCGDDIVVRFVRGVRAPILTSGARSIRPVQSGRPPSWRHHVVPGVTTRHAPAVPLVVPQHRTPRAQASARSPSPPITRNPDVSTAGMPGLGSPPTGRPRGPGDGSEQPSSPSSGNMVSGSGGGPTARTRQSAPNKRLPRSEGQVCSVLAVGPRTV